MHFVLPKWTYTIVWVSWPFDHLSLRPIEWMHLYKFWRCKKWMIFCLVVVHGKFSTTMNCNRMGGSFIICAPDSCLAATKWINRIEIVKIVYKKTNWFITFTITMVSRVESIWCMLRLLGYFHNPRFTSHTFTYITHDALCKCVSRSYFGVPFFPYLIKHKIITTIKSIQCFRSTWMYLHLIGNLC